MDNIKQKCLIIFGGTGTAVEIEEIVKTYYSYLFKEIKIVWFEENWISKNGVDKLLDLYDVYYILGVAEYNIRQNCLEQLEDLPIKPYSVVHPSAICALSAEIGAGSYIAANVSVSSGVKLAGHCLINLNASIGHDAILGRHCIVNPGARVSGNVTLAEGVMLGSNAFIFQNQIIGRESWIDAMTYIREDVDSYMIISVRGNRKIRRKLKIKET